MTEQISEGQQAILNQITPIIVEKLGVALNEVRMEAYFENDLGADSLDIVELMMDFEKEYNLSIPDDQQESIKTIGDVVRLIEQMSDAPKYRKTHEVAKPNTNEKKPNIQEKQPVIKNTTAGTKKSAASKTIFSGNIMKMTVEQALGLPMFQRPVYEMLDGTGGLRALNSPLGDVLSQYLQKQQVPQK